MFVSPCLELQIFSSQLFPLCWFAHRGAASVSPSTQNLLRLHRVSPDFKVYEGRRRLHPPPTDSASSGKPSDHKNAGKKENGSWWECLFLYCRWPQTVSVHLRSGTQAFLRSSSRSRTEVRVSTHTWGRRQHLSQAEGGSDIQLKPASSKWVVEPGNTASAPTLITVSVLPRWKAHML